MTKRVTKQVSKRVTKRVSKRLPGAATGWNQEDGMAAQNGSVRARCPRSLFFVPGGQADLIAKIPRWSPDVAVLDLEDAVAPPDKEAARRTALDGAARLAGELGEVAVFLRVNAASTPWFVEDVRAACAGDIAGLVLPKVEHPDDLARVAELLDEAGRAELVLIGGVETARGVADARTLLAARRDAAGLAAVYFGAEDLTADLGGRRSPGGLEVLYARSRVRLAAALAGVHAIDQAVVDPYDEAAFEEDAQVGRDLGYGGKICIHPRQVELANRVFSPTPEEIAHAEAVLAAARRAQAAGSGVTVVDGRMVDAPHIKAATAVLRAAGRVSSDES